MEGFRKIIALFLIIGVLFFAALSILSIWDIIEVEQLFQKSILTLIVLFCSSAVILFVFSNFLKSNGEDNLPPR